ncbi:hypothetical protein HaLaN_07572, partial [Haematococcus lacustris]
MQVEDGGSSPRPKWKTVGAGRTSGESSLGVFEDVECSHGIAVKRESDVQGCTTERLKRRVSAQLTDVPSAPSPPSPPLLAARPPGPPLYTPLPQQPNVTRIELLITFYGLDLWSLVTSWGSGIQALLGAQQPPSLSMQNLTAPGMCASQLLALDTTALFNTPLTPMELMPALNYFTMDVAQLLRDYLGDSSIMVQVPDFCAGDRIATPRFVNRTLVNVTLPTLHVAVNLLDATPERLLPPFGLLGQLLRNCRGALMNRDSLGFFTLYAMSF